jgi:hypothetical protein
METVSTKEELFEAIDRLPDTIESVRIPTSLDWFNPPSIEVTPEDGEDWRDKIKDTVREALELPRGEEVDEFNLRSYFGKRKGVDTNPYYIQYSSEGCRKFADDMSSGKYGSLD